MDKIDVGVDQKECSQSKRVYEYGSYQEADDVAFQTCLFLSRARTHSSESAFFIQETIL
jgi:hypothetical protein